MGRGAAPASQEYPPPARYTGEGEFYYLMSPLMVVAKTEQILQYCSLSFTRS